MEINTQNIHHEFRTTHLVIDKRVNNIVMDLSKVAEKLKIVQNEVPSDYLEKHFRPDSANLKPRSHTRQRHESRTSVIQRSIVGKRMVRSTSS